MVIKPIWLRIEVSISEKMETQIRDLFLRLPEFHFLTWDNLLDCYPDDPKILLLKMQFPAFVFRKEDFVTVEDGQILESISRIPHTLEERKYLIERCVERGMYAKIEPLLTAEERVQYGPRG